MKTLDEVIKAVHHCGLLTGFDDTYEYDGGCPYEDCSECEKKRVLGKDIIQYLMAYKDDKNERTALRAFWKEQHDNHPLDWDELRKMEGKPVWWAHGEVGEWLTIYRVPSLGNGNDNVIYATTCSGVECWIWRKDLDKFQYYRKERE